MDGGFKWNTFYFIFSKGCSESKLFKLYFIYIN